MRKLLIISLMLSYIISIGHGGEEYKNKKQDSAKIENTVHNHEELEEGHNEKIEDHHIHEAEHHEHGDSQIDLKAGFEDFPTLHSLVVYFLIVLLLLATLNQIAGFFVFKNELGWIRIESCSRCCIYEH